MRRILATLVAVSAVSLALTAAAQTAPPPPPKLQPLPEAPAPPPEIANDPELAPQITTIKRENETVDEYRVHGQLKMIKVTPRHGQPYYLIADAANGGFIRRDSLDSGLKVPLWVLFSF